MFQRAITCIRSARARNHNEPDAGAQRVLVFPHDLAQTSPNLIAREGAADSLRCDEAGADSLISLHWEDAQ